MGILFKEKDFVRVVPSDELSAMNLTAMIGQCGVITECLFEKRRNPGCMVLFSESFEGHFSWFIPLNSLSLCK